MTWAARYSRTEQPELTIYRDGDERDHWTIEEAGWALEHLLAPSADVLNDIAARVPVRECEETQACTNWAMPDGRCHHLHGGSDEL